MAKCSLCGRNGLFLKLDNTGNCIKCKEELTRKALEKENNKLEQLRHEEEKQRKTEQHQKTHDSQNHEIGSLFTFAPVRVAGVSFRNGQRSRQTILRSIYWKDDPYKHIDPNKCIDLVPILFEGTKAVEVWVHSKDVREQIGYIPKEESTFFFDNLYRIHSVFGFNVSGGGSGTNGESYNYGASFTARFYNQPGQGDVDQSLFDSFLYLKELEASTISSIAYSNAYRAFIKRYPHALLHACSPQQGRQNTLVMHVCDTVPILSTYLPEKNGVLIEFSDGSRDNEFVTI